MGRPTGRKNGQSRGREKLAKDFAARLYQARIKADFTQQQLASVALVAQSQVAKWEIGNDLPPLDAVVTMAKALKCTVGWLAAGETHGT